MTRRMQLPFPDPALGGARAEAVARGWEALLARSPRLRPWVAEVLATERRLLSAEESETVDAQLWGKLERWLHAFDALPPFATSAIATTLGEDDDGGPGETNRILAAARAEIRFVPSDPESALQGQQTLLEDPAFALAAFCVEARIVPVLPAGVPQGVAFGLIRAAASQEATLTARTAILLVLRCRGEAFSALDTPARHAALRLFGALPSDLKGATDLALLLPAGWGTTAATFVEAAGRARLGFDEACGLCSRLANGALRAAPERSLGGLAHLFDAAAAAPSAEEVREIARAASNHPPSSGLRRVASLL